MKEYIERAALMGALTAGTEQLSMREMAGAEAYNEFLALVNNIPAARRREMRTPMFECYEFEECEYNAQPKCCLPDGMECPHGVKAIKPTNADRNRLLSQLWRSHGQGGRA